MTEPDAGYHHAVCSVCQRTIHSGAVWNNKLHQELMVRHPQAGSFINVKQKGWKDIPSSVPPCEGTGTQAEVVFY